MDGKERGVFLSAYGLGTVQRPSDVEVADILFFFSVVEREGDQRKGIKDKKVKEGG